MKNLKFNHRTWRKYFEICGHCITCILSKIIFLLNKKCIMSKFSLSKSTLITLVIWILLIVWVRYSVSQWPTRSALEFSWNYQKFEQLSWNIIDSDKVTVLYFYAPRCPSCRAWHLTILSEVSTIPYNLQILNIDYDTNQALRKKYGVTSQHTFILIDNNSNLVDKAGWLDTVSEIIKFAEPLLSNKQ